LPQPKPPGPGGSCPFGYTLSGSCPGRAGRGAETAERHLPVGLDRERIVLPAQRGRRALG